MKIKMPHYINFESGRVMRKLRALCFASSLVLVDSFVLRNQCNLPLTGGLQAGLIQSR
jgi:hypothetical protein